MHGPWLDLEKQIIKYVLGTIRKIWIYELDILGNYYCLNVIMVLWLCRMFLFLDVLGWNAICYLLSNGSCVYVFPYRVRKDQLFYETYNYTFILHFVSSF